jgi:hypothetical protein
LSTPLNPNIVRACSPTGGWKYLSTQLWTTNYEDLPEDIEDKIWW